MESEQLKFYADEFVKETNYIGVLTLTEDEEEIEKYFKKNNFDIGEGYWDLKTRLYFLYGIKFNTFVIRYHLEKYKKELFELINS